MSLRKQEILVEPLAGADITDSIYEAIILSAEERSAVRFDFNETPVYVDVRVWVEDIYRAWLSRREKGKS